MICQYATPPTSLEYDDMVCGIVAQFTTCTILVSGADPEGGVSVGGWGGGCGGEGAETPCTVTICSLVAKNLHLTRTTCF